MLQTKHLYIRCDTNIIKMKNLSETIHVRLTKETEAIINKILETEPNIYKTKSDVIRSSIMVFGRWKNGSTRKK